MNTDTFKQSIGVHYPRHFIIHSVRPKQSAVPNVYENRYFDLRVTGINENGDIISSIERVFICANTFWDKAQKFAKFRIIFDQTYQCKNEGD